jgi:ribosomal protein S18 acetylase RimI-like enzyme
MGGLVYHLAIEESYRKHGLGKALMIELENRLRAIGCRRCYLLVTKDNDSAIRFYEMSGWEKMDLHLFAKDLDA